MAKILVAAHVAASAAGQSEVRAEAKAEEPAIRPTLPWVMTQLLPSPEVVVGQGTARLGLRWQITPFLYSWGIHRKLSPFRGLVAEPNVRQSGSVEVFL